MLDEQRELIKSRTSKYISIGISENGEAYGVINVPWELTATAFNMKTPDVYISREDTADEEIIALLSSFHVVGCYIFCPLEDYSFLSRFTEIADLNIYNGENVRDLSFIEDYSEFRMFMLSKAHLKNLDEFTVMKDKYNYSVPKCLALHDCIIDDISSLESKNHSFTELIVSNPKSRNERNRWSSVKAFTKRYYEF